MHCINCNHWNCSFPPPCPDVLLYVIKFNLQVAVKCPLKCTVKLSNIISCRVFKLVKDCDLYFYNTALFVTTTFYNYKVDSFPEELNHFTPLLCF